MTAARTCIDCAGPISASSKGRCRSCGARSINRDRDIIDRRSAAMAAVQATPEFRARHAEACRVAKIAMMQDPVAMEKLRRAGREVGSKNFWRANTAECRAAARHTLRARGQPWCPEEFWELNRDLRRKGLPLEERKAAILEHVPGTVEHARREIANRELASRLRQERDRAQSY